MNDWKQLLLTTSIDELLQMKSRPLITVTTTTSIQNTLKILSEANILSVPVIDNDDLQGLVDVVDITGYILATWRSLSPSFDHQVFPDEDLLNTPIFEVMNFSLFDSVKTIKGTESVFNLMQMFLDDHFQMRLHRVLTTDWHGLVYNVVSQTDLINFAYAHMDKLPEDLLDSTIEDLDLFRVVINVREESFLIDALSILFKNRLSGLALVDNNYKITGNLSCSDLRGITPTSFEFFQGKVSQFLNKIEEEQGTTRKPFIFVQKDNTFRELLKILTESHVHRVFLKDELEHPIGVISLSDVLSKII
eukprot:TRINITY_DN13319_c0_g1_i1.p1 TRINITY_DN13319_c0_g1~~TRINITY_DN13319_c0_g1_i1.p1  ORF type:complete len:314 (+),score=51.85 TRINITY_DN13319_c0_g1_i1:29-943(+)